MRRRRSSCPASFRCAAAFSISFRRMPTIRCGSSCSATRSNRSGGSMSPRSAASKRSQSTTITMLEPTASDRAHFTSYLPPSTWFLLIEPSELAEEGKFYLERMDRPQAFSRGAADAGGNLQVSVGHGVGRARRVAGNDGPSGVRIGRAVQRRDRQGPRRAGQGQRRPRGVRRLRDGRGSASGSANCLRRRKLLAAGQLHFVVGHLEAGFRIVPQRIALVSAAELFQRQDLARTTRRRQARAIDSFLELREGDLVVHLAHGIGRYRGLRLLGEGRPGRRAPGAGVSRRHEDLRAGGEDRARAEVRRRQGRKAVLAHIGGKAWVRQKEAAQRAVTDLAAEMLELQAARDARPGIAFPPDTEWQREFDAAFPYQETPDQLTAIDAIKRDMHAARPMDRLLCGDVGFGKTELAIRAAFKAIDAGYQVAVLVPTTVLAEQHRRTFTRADGRVSVRDRRAFAVLHGEGAARDPRAHGRRDRSTSSSARIAWRRPTCSSQNLGLLDHRRGAAVRRGDQGAAQSAARDGRRADDDRHADSAHAAHVAVGRAGDFQPGNAAGRSAGRRDARHAVQRRARCATRSCAS